MKGADDVGVRSLRYRVAAGEWKTSGPSSTDFLVLVLGFQVQVEGLEQQHMSASTIDA